MGEDKSQRLLSDGTQPPALPSWVVVLMVVGFGAVVFVALSKVAYVVTFFGSLWHSATAKH